MEVIVKRYVVCGFPSAAMNRPEIDVELSAQRMAGIDDKRMAIGHPSFPLNAFGIARLYQK
jgi:hypothetical protein